MATLQQINREISQRYGNIREAKKALGIRSSAMVRSQIARELAQKEKGRKREETLKTAERFERKAEKKRQQARASIPAPTPGSVERTAKGERIFRSPSGLVLRKETPVISDGQRLTKVEEFVKSPVLTSAVAKPSDLEEAKLQAIKSPPPSAFDQPIFSEEFRKEYPALASYQEARLREKILEPGKATLRSALEERQFRDRTLEALQTRIDRAKTPEQLELALAERKKFRQAEILARPPSFGKVEPLAPGEKLTVKRFGQQAVGGISKTFQVIGEAEEERVGELIARKEFTIRQKIGKRENPIVSSAREIQVGTAKLYRGAVRGGVTKIGTDKTTATLFAGAGIVGAGIGVLKGAGVIGWVGRGISGVPRITSVAKGISLGTRVGTYGLLGTGAVVSAKRGGIEGVGEFGGSVLGFGTAFKTGLTAGGIAGTGIKTASIKSYQAISGLPSPRKLPGLRGLGKAGAVRRGGRRISPKAKAEIRREQRGLPPRKQKPGFKVSQQGQDRIVKIRQPEVRKAVGEQLGTQVKEVRVKGKPSKVVAVEQQLQTGKVTGVLKQTFPKRVEIITKPKGDIFQVVKVPPKAKPVKPSKPIYPKAPTVKPPKPSVAVDTGRQQLITTLKTPKTAKVTISKAKVVRLRPEQKLLPPESRFSAQNIGKDVLVDVSQPTTYAPTTKTPEFKGGFRPGTREALQSKLELQKAFRQAELQDIALQKQYEALLRIKKPDLKLGVLPALDEQRLVIPQLEFKVDVVPTLASRSSTFMDLEPVVDVKVDEEQAVDYSQSQDLVEEQAQLFNTGSGGVGRTRSFTTPTTPTPPSEPAPQEPTIGLFPTVRPVRTPPPVNPFVRRARGSPPLPKFFPRLGKRVEQEGLFQAFARVRGKFQAVGLPTSKLEAFNIGKSFVGRTPARTFGVKELGTPGFKGIDFRTKDDKVKKKRKGRFGFLFIEPSRFAIDQPGEVAGITLKGLQTKKARRRRK